jgi:hypothetical protein
VIEVEEGARSKEMEDGQSDVVEREGEAGGRRKG